jgi:hypothetical protein
MPYAYWVDAIKDRTHPEHKKVLNRSVAFFSSHQLIALLGEKVFIETWRAIRDDVDRKENTTRQAQVILDGVWRFLVTGFAFGGRAFHIQKPLSRQLKATYEEIANSTNKNIYQVARDMNRPYSRVFVDIHRLRDLNLVKTSLSVRAGKKVTLLNAA